VATIRSALTLAALALLFVPALHAQPAAPAQPPDPALEDFTQRIAKYAALRSELQAGLPPLAGAGDFESVRNAELALAQRLRSARSAATQGEFFTAPIAAAFRNILKQIDLATWEAITDEKPAAFPQRVNDAYPKTEPLSTVPPNLLAQLPRLPDGLQYRFVGGNLILHDTQANLIVDRLSEAISMRPPRRPAI
jgi:hypothetical protein